MPHRARSLAVPCILICLAAAIEVHSHIITEPPSKHFPVDCRSNTFPDDCIPSRRWFLKQACKATLSTPVLLNFPYCASAEDVAAATTTQENPAGSKPYAPVEALLPAARCKVWIDRAYGLSSQLPASINNDTKESAVRLLQDLDRTLAAPPTLFTKNDKPLRANLGATAQITASVSSANKSQYRQNRQDLSVPNQLAAIFNQADVERQWGMLQYAESNREKDNVFRAAFNYYTQQLVFNGDSYLLTASPDQKKKMIRSGQGLPTLTAVVTSDLDLRDLYRNQFLTAIDDARAEVAYQVKQPLDAIDLADTIMLMNQAHAACNNWFGLIPKEDVEEALKSISGGL